MELSEEKNYTQFIMKVINSAIAITQENKDIKDRELYLRNSNSSTSNFSLSQQSRNTRNTSKTSTKLTNLIE